MKRIIALLLAALLLSFAGCITLNGCTLSCTAPVTYSNADKYTAGDFTYDAAKVRKVEIDWMSGSITLVNGTGTLSVSESGANTLSEEEQMHWWLDGTTLRIRFCKSGHKIEFEKIQEQQKALTVELPPLADLEIDVGSGRVIAGSELTLGTFKLDTASGGTEIKALSAKECKIDSASGGIVLGKVSVSGSFTVNSASGGFSAVEITADKLDIDSASGGISLTILNTEEADVDSVSGNVSIGVGDVGKMKIDSTSGSIVVHLLNKTAGARIKHSAVSGNFNTSLGGVNSGDVLTIGNGETEIEISIVSGSVTVE